MTKYPKNRKVKVPITKDDLRQLLRGSEKRFYDAVNARPGSPMYKVHGNTKPVAIALCQGAAMHYQNGKTGYTDFDVFLFYDKNKPLSARGRHPASRRARKWCYTNPKYPRGNIQVDVLVRRIEANGKNPTEIIRHFLHTEPTDTAHHLAKAAVVLLHPPKQLGKVIWYNGEAVG